MKIRYSLHTAATGLKTHKSRSILTTLGIVIGICAIILVMSVGQGAQDLILNQIRGLGAKTIVIEPGRKPSGPSSFSEIFTDSLRERDIQALLNKGNVQGIVGLTPVVMQVVPISYGSESVRKDMVGGSEFIAEILQIYPAQGEFFTADQVLEKANVAVMGSKVKESLFGDSDAVGEKIKIKDKTFRVIGVLPAKGQAAFFNADEMVVVPYTTAQQYLTGTSHFNSIMAQTESEDIVPRVVRDVESTIRETHNIEDPSKDDFHVTTQAEAMQTVSQVTGILTVLLTSVAAISLVVGGIGIMNIMLVSVTERTREIGLRKAVGATRRDIMTQFLLEATMLCAIGGVIGIVLGAGLSFLASVVLSKALALHWVFTVPLTSILLGLGVSTAVGITFGLYPARQASLKSPMEALRYE